MDTPGDCEAQLARPEITSYIKASSRGVDKGWRMYVLIPRKYGKSLQEVCKGQTARCKRS